MRTTLTVSRYAHDLFEIGVGFSTRSGVEHPVVVVPSGVQVPVAAKRDLADRTGRMLVKLGDVYFRTLSSSGVPSTSVARPQDWRDIVDICFENREADIGRFLRRQLAGVDPASLAAALTQLGFATTVATIPQPETLQTKVEELLAKGEQRFLASLETRTVPQEDQYLLEAGTWEVAMVVEPGWPSRVPDNEFAGTVFGSNPRYTGWPVWLDARLSAMQENRPVVRDRSYEALIVTSGGFTSHLDFMRLDPSGKFYLRRALQDDIRTEKVSPGTVLDPILVILRVAEAIAVGIAIARSQLVEGEPPRRLGFGFQWSKLAGRSLSTWANPMYPSMGGRLAHEGNILTFIELPSDTPANAIAPYVDAATRDLFALFDGERVAPSDIEDWTAKLLERRL